MTAGEKHAAEAASVLRDLPRPLGLDRVETLFQAAEALASARLGGEVPPGTARAVSTAVCRLSSLGQRLSGQSPSIRACLDALLGLGRFGWQAAARLVEGKLIQAEHLDLLCASLAPERRLFLLHGLLRRSWLLDKPLQAAAREALKGLESCPPREILAALAALDRLGDGPAFPVREALLRGSFRPWLDGQLRGVVLEVELPDLARAVSALGEATLSARLAAAVIAHPAAAGPEAMEVLSRCLNAGPEPLSRAVQAVLKAGSSACVAHCMDVLVGLGWPRTGRVLALLHKKDAGVRRAVASRAATLPETAYRQFVASFGREEGATLQAAVFAALARADTEFVRDCLEAEALDRGLPPDLAAYLDAQPERAPVVSPPEEAPAGREAEEGGGQRKGLLSLFKGEKRPELAEELARSGRLADQDFRGAHLSRVTVENHTLSGLDLSGAELDNVNFRKCRLSGLNLAGARLDAVAFIDCELTDLDLRDAVLDDCRFASCSLSDSGLGEAVFQGGSATGSLLERCDFGGTFFFGVSWTECTARGLGLAGARILQAQVRSCRLEDGDLSFAALESCRLEGVVFEDCLFQGAVIQNCSFEGGLTEGCLFPGCRVLDTDTDDADLLQARAGSMRLLLHEAEASGPTPPPAGHEDLCAGAVARFVRQWQMGRFERRMLSDNARRRRLALRRMTPGQADFFLLLPHLLHTRLFETKAGIEDVPLCRVAGHHPDLRTLELARRHFAGVRPRKAQGRPLSIEAVYTIGSLGSIAQTASSDMDVWVCYERPGIGPAAEARLRRKLEALEQWAQIEFGAEVHFFPMGLDDVRANNFGFSDKESAGTAQALLLKEEFYRTALRLAGKELLWWLLPPGADQGTHEDFARFARESTLLGPGRVVDLGRLAPVPPAEFFGASLWQIVKGLHSPYKSVMKLGLLEKYAGQDGPPEYLLCDQIKDCVVRRLSEAWQVDPYTVLFRSLREYYTTIGEQDALSLLTEAFGLKAGIEHFDMTFGHPPSAEEASFLSFLCGRDSVDRDLLCGLRKDGGFPRAMKAGTTVGRFMINTYRRIQARLAAAGAGAASISPEDLTKLGRMIQSHFAPRGHKVVRVPFLEIRGRFAEIHLEAEKAPGRATVWLARGQEAGAAKVAVKGMSVLHRDASPAMLLAWLVANGIFSPETHVHGERSLAPLSVDDAKKVLTALHEFFPLEETFEVDMEEMLRPERVTKAFLALNLTSQPESQRIESVAVVYATNWGELFCRTLPHPDARLSRQASAFLREVLPHPLPQPPEMHLFIPRKSQCPRIRLL